LDPSRGCPPSGKQPERDREGERERERENVKSRRHFNIKVESNISSFDYNPRYKGAKLSISEPKL